MHAVAVARHAMATRFEIILHGENAVSLRAAAEEALDEIERLDGQLSLYNPASDISHINARAARGPVRVEPALFHLLQRAKVGMRLVELNEGDFTVRFVRQGVMLDLGSIGKGYALERAAGLLKDAGVTSGLLHGGTSTVCAIGAPPDAEAWKVAVPHPDFGGKPVCW